MRCSHSEGSGKCPRDKGQFLFPGGDRAHHDTKVCDGRAAYRQRQEFKRNGILLSRNWLIKAAEDWLEPIYDALHEMLCSHDVLHADETTLQVLHEPGKTAQSKSYMWLYRTSGDAAHPIVLYEYQPDRKSARPQAFLKNYKGYLHADGYDGYHKLPESITVVGC